MIIEQQQVDGKFGEFVLVLREKFSLAPRRKMFFFRLTSRLYFIQPPARIRAYPPVLLDFEGDLDGSSRRSASSSKCRLFARLSIFL
jgi:hypothetical protein